MIRVDVNTPGVSDCASPCITQAAGGRAQIGGVAVTDELVALAKDRAQRAEGALRTKRDAHERTDADGEVQRCAAAVADLNRQAADLRQARLLLHHMVHSRHLRTVTLCSHCYNLFFRPLAFTVVKRPSLCGARVTPCAEHTLPGALREVVWPRQQPGPQSNPVMPLMWPAQERWRLASSAESATRQRMRQGEALEKEARARALIESSGVRLQALLGRGQGAPPRSALERAASGPDCASAPGYKRQGVCSFTGRQQTSLTVTPPWMNQCMRISAHAVADS